MDLAALRSDRGLTQAALAERLGISPGHVADIERGHRKPSLKLAGKIAEFFERPDLVAQVVAEKLGDAA